MSRIAYGSLKFGEGVNNLLPLNKSKQSLKTNQIMATMTYFERLQDLVNGWGYSENEAREILADEGYENTYQMHDFEC